MKKTQRRLKALGLSEVDYQFEFTKWWFASRNLKAFCEFVLPEFQDKPTLYLEIGVFEAMSLSWMLQNVLTHSDSKAVGVDPWLMTTKLDNDQMNLVHNRAIHNCLYFDSKCTLIQGNSAEVLRRMLALQNGYKGICRGGVDVIMIDGDHNKGTVYDDACLSLKLLKTQGLLIFDDIDVRKSVYAMSGFNQFLETYSDKVEFVWETNLMQAYRKL